MSAKKRFAQLVQAFHMDDRASVDALLRGGVVPDAEPADANGDSLLALAVRRGRTEMAELLLAGGAAADHANAAGETPRQLARDATDPRLAQMFELPSAVASATARLWNAIEQAIAEGERGVPPSTILPRIADADLALRRRGRTPLLALAAGRVRGAELYAALLAAGADPAAVDDTGATALHYLADAGLGAEARAIASASPRDALDGLGRSPLHLAVSARAIAVVTLLLDLGVNAERADGAGRTPLDLADGHIRELLLDRPGVSVVGDLERALRARWSLADLEAYGDVLQAAGDPRGELVALDLRPAPTSVKWRERRRGALEAWLGPVLGQRAQTQVHAGFLPHLHDRGGYNLSNRPGRSRTTAALLDHPAGRYVRVFSVSGSADRVLASMHRLARASRPFLTEIAVSIIGPAPPRAHGSLVAALIVATPSLRALYVAGPPPFTTFPHPGLRRCIATHGMGGTPVPPQAPVDVQDFETVLEAIHASPDLASFRATYGDLFPSLDDRLASLVAAGLAESDDGALRLTALGLLRLADHTRPGARS